MTRINPKHAADISKAFDDYSKLIKSEPQHPTETTKGSVWVNHADGTFSHWQVRRSMSISEVRRQHRLTHVADGRKMQARLWFRLARMFGLDW